MTLTPPVRASHAQTHADRIFELVESAIVSGELPPGSRLGEEALAARFGVSRGPLREALRQLEGRGLVVRTAHAGARVVTLTRADLIEIYEIRANLEGLACRLAAARASEADLEALEALLDEHMTGDALRSGEAYPQKHGVLDFHFALAAASKSRRLEQLLCHDYYSLVRLFRHRTSHRAGHALRAFDDHRRIVQALRERDGEFAELLMRRHVQTARRELETMDEVFAPGETVVPWPGVAAGD